jgi:hypothetical protein
VIDITKESKGMFSTTLREARPGERIIYARGLSCTGHHRHDAMAAYQRGLVILMQKRNGPSDFDYIAQKLDPKRRKT